MLLRSFQSPGDVLMLTAAVRDLHAAAPGRFHTDVRTACPALWENNPHLTPLREGDPGVEVLDMHYPLVHQSNQQPFHFLHGYPQYLEERLGVRVPVTRFHGDVHLSDAERQGPPPGRDAGVPERFWIVVAGGKYDFTAKWWDPARFQRVVDHFRGVLRFIQCGEAGHWHPPLDGVLHRVGRTSPREFVRLMHHADGVLCGVTFAMHLAAAVPTRPDRPPRRPCVVVAGGREPAHWEAYPGHQFLTTVGTLPCCAAGGCWRSRCQPVGDGDEKDRRDLCEQPVALTPALRIPRCMHLITADDVIRRIELYLEAGRPAAPEPPPAGAGALAATPAPAPPGPTEEADAVPPPPQRRSVLIEFAHGLGDAVQLTVVLRHLRVRRPDWDVDVASLIGKHTAHRGLCRRALVLGSDSLDRSAYDRVYRLAWEDGHTPETGCPSTKAARCLREVFDLDPDPALFTYSVEPGEEDVAAARVYLTEVCGGPAPAGGRFPVLLLHYQGNTSGTRKDLLHEVARGVCTAALTAGVVPVILDWDRRSPLPDGRRVHCPGADHPLWGGTGTGDAARLAALVALAGLAVGVDSGPLHVAGATATPTLGVWTAHHPVRFYDRAANVTHLVPERHADLAPGPQALAYFTANYRHRTYRDLGHELPELVGALLAGEGGLGRVANKQLLGELRATGYGEAYYREHRRAGLDYLAYGDWQRQYGRWLVEALRLRGRRLLDAGCACGALLRGLAEAGAVGEGIDLSEHMVALGRHQWPELADRLHVCDAVHLHPFAAGAFDAVHTAQAAEHWRPELAPFVLAELARVTRPGGLLFCCLDTAELFARQGRRLEAEDPTHVCVRPLTWWLSLLPAAGWQPCTAEYEPTLRDHPDSFLGRYDWDYFVARRRAG